ncbi:hypothetical protein QOZ80_3AG0218730 [Eleusine coracana subsp. coracana]|nr:hypothetical protein QOZ80_3AG0218730 [Eleusine coracana subsp. coracana]
MLKHFAQGFLWLLLGNKHPLNPKPPRFDDCKDCFNLALARRERRHWLVNSTMGKNNKLAFSVDEVLASASPLGSVRVRGVDAGAQGQRGGHHGQPQRALGSAPSWPCAGSCRSMSALPRGCYSSITCCGHRALHARAQRLAPAPRDAINSRSSTSVYRVLQPDGLFCLDHFFCGEAEMPAYVEVLESVGFRKLRWVTGKKRDRGPRKEMYLSALLEKPLQNSW